MRVAVPQAPQFRLPAPGPPRVGDADGVAEVPGRYETGEEPAAGGDHRAEPLWCHQGRVVEHGAQGPARPDRLFEKLARAAA